MKVLIVPARFSSVFFTCVLSQELEVERRSVCPVDPIFPYHRRGRMGKTLCRWWLTQSQKGVRSSAGLVKSSEPGGDWMVLRKYGVERE